MQALWNKTISQIKLHLPLTVVVLVALVITAQNIDLNVHYTGWDNIHAEFNLTRYAKQVFFGAWLEHQGPGAPAGLAHASEISRLPILFILKLLLPDNLVRYTFIFLMYLIGGIGTYYFLSKYWLRENLNRLGEWIASLGAVFYLLHILTLQQFYISFELFTIQFAFLPFLLIAVHKLAKNINIRTVFIFFVIQLLIAPSGHTPTLFYLGTLLAIVYAFFLKLDKAPFVEAVKFSLVVGLLALFANAYWIIPNIHYTFNNAHYVTESRENHLFAPESLWSIREASTFENFLNGTHYLFSWKDFSLAEQEYQYIFDEWLPHLTSPSVQVILSTLGRITIIGFFLLLYAKHKGKQRIGIIFMYLTAIIFIWIDLFPTKNIFEMLFQNGSFLEAFRNPFTKLSVIYSFVSVLIFTYTFEFIVSWLEKRNWKMISGKLVSLVLIAITFTGIFYSAIPSFQGHFISEVLQVKYPNAYNEFYDYLNTRDKDLRILELPQVTQAGWEIYDWSFIEPGNGYQGLGFKFFGIPQAIMNRDSDRWVETSDFFYHELKYALDSQNTAHFTDLLNKYHIDLIVIDETRLDPHSYHEFQDDHQLAKAARLQKVWQKDFLTIYERMREGTESELLTPTQVALADGDTARVRKDVIYDQVGDYVLTKNNHTEYFPFAGLMSPEPSNIAFSDAGAVFTKNIPTRYNSLEVPGNDAEYYLTPVMITYRGNNIHLNFPQYQVEVGEESISLPSLPDRTVALDEPSEKILLFINNVGIEVEKNKPVQPILKLDTNDGVKVHYIAKIPEFVDASTPTTELASYTIDWTRFKKDLVIPINSANKITYTIDFPVTALNLNQNLPANCADNELGSIATENTPSGVEYTANDFGVNCAGYIFDYMSSAYSYLLQVTGENYEGRGIKMFLDYSDSDNPADQFIFPEKEFTKYISFNQVSDDPRTRYLLNWETRSFGRSSSTKLESLQILPYPAEQLAGMRLRTANSRPINNQITINSHKRYLESIHLVDYQCQTSSCYLGLDQSWDKLWVAIPLHKPGLTLPHFRLNNWANIWYLSEGEGTIAILYVPQLLSTAFLLFLIGVTLLLIYLVQQNPYSQSYLRIKDKLITKLQGE